VAEPSVAAQEELAMLAAMPVAVSPRARIAQLAELVAETVVALGPCRMWELAKVSIFRKQLTSMSDVVATSMPSAPEGISLVSSQQVVC